MNIESLSELQNKELRKLNPDLFPEYSKHTTGFAQVAGKDEGQYPSMPKRRSVKNAMPVDSKIKESDFQLEVIDFLEKNNWRVHAERSARTKDGWCTPVQGTPGWIDIFACKNGVALAWELKSDIGKASPEQVEWLLALSLCGVMTEK